MSDAVRHLPQAQAQAQAQPARAVAAAWGQPEPYAPMPLSPAARAGLMGLRILLGLVTAMAGFTFLHGLHG